MRANTSSRQLCAIYSCRRDFQRFVSLARRASLSTTNTDDVCVFPRSISVRQTIPPRLNKRKKPPRSSTLRRYSKKKRKKRMKTANVIYTVSAPKITSRRRFDGVSSWCLVRIRMNNNIYNNIIGCVKRFYRTRAAASSS